MSDEAWERCPGCGSVLQSHTMTCYPLTVDTTQVGYRYLENTWGYCRVLKRHVFKNETPWMDVALREAKADGWDEGVSYDPKYYGPYLRALQAVNPYRD